MFILQLKWKITNHPVERWKSFLQSIYIFFLIWLCWSTHLDVFGKIDHETQILKCILINRPHGIVDEATWRQNCQSKYFCVMCCVLIKGTYSLGINDYDIDILPIRRSSPDRLIPAPQSLGARIDSRSNSKSIASTKQNPIQQIWFASSIQPRNTNNSKRSLYRFEEINGLVSDDIFCILNVVLLVI